jgi:hypothetical protein
MAEVTDSFCERCGTKYVFAPSGPKGFSLKGARVLAKGLRNFVLTDGQSIADAMQLARHDDGHQAMTQMAEVFHKTFNFCMSCRQYACERCWNAAAGACLSCSPAVEPEAELTARPTVLAEDAPEAPAASGEAAWPAVDLPDRQPAPYAADGSDASSSHDDEAPIPWPIADQLAPDMTLTAGELDLIQARLSQGQPPANVPMQRPVEEPVVASVSEPAVVESDLPAAAVHMLHRIASTPTLPPLMSMTPRATAAEPAGLVARLLGRRGQETASSTGAAPRRVAARKDQPVRDPWPAPTAWMQRSLDGSRWSSGLYAAAAEPISAPAAEFVPDHAETQSAATHELEFKRVVEQVPAVADRDLRQAELVATPAEFVPSVQSSEQSAPKPTPTPVDSSTADIDPRSAAALRLSAVEGAADPEDARPPMQQTQFGASAEETSLPVVSREPAWLRVQREAADTQARAFQPPARLEESVPAPASNPATPSEPNEPKAAAEAPQPAPIASWPPLGASWPTRESPGAPWPGPDPASVPALLAAQQFPEQALAELWVQSSQEVMNRGSVRVCGSCALPVSPRARFCRRCGSQQA